MVVFFKVTAGQAPDPEWEVKLDKVSGKFRELKTKAAGWTHGTTAQSPDPAHGKH
jgi:hypothetical protein